MAGRCVYPSISAAGWYSSWRVHLSSTIVAILEVDKGGVAHREEATVIVSETISEMVGTEVGLEGEEEEEEEEEEGGMEEATTMAINKVGCSGQDNYMSDPTPSLCRSSELPWGRVWSES